MNPSCAALGVAARRELVPSFINIKVSEVQEELQQERLRFGDADQIAKLNVLRKAEDLIGTDRWDPRNEGAGNGMQSTPCL